MKGGQAKLCCLALSSHLMPNARRSQPSRCLQQAVPWLSSLPCSPLWGASHAPPAQGQESCRRRAVRCFGRKSCSPHSQAAARAGLSQLTPTLPQLQMSLPPSLKQRERLGMGRNTARHSLCFCAKSYPHQGRAGSTDPGPSWGRLWGWGFFFSPSLVKFSLEGVSSG